MTRPAFAELDFSARPAREVRTRARSYRAILERRRSVRDFSSRAVPRKLIEDALRAAANAPSGRNGQPWTFVAVSRRSLKRRIRLAAEEVAVHLVQDVAAHKRLATPWSDVAKRFFEAAPWLIVVFARPGRLPRSYVTESVGIAVGVLVAALQGSGLGTLVHRPEPKYFLNEMCDRPHGERPFALIVVGHPAEPCLVPVLERRAFGDMAVFVE